LEIISFIKSIGFNDSNELQIKGVDFVLNKPFLIDQVLKLVQEGIELKAQLQHHDHPLH
jgi:predicted Fe-Mo cluster-binding NifX family protein